MKSQWKKPRLKEAGIATEIIAGVAQCQETLCAVPYTLGADRGILIETNAELQPLAVLHYFAAVVKQESPSLVILGKQAIDDDANQTGNARRFVDLPQAPFASTVEWRTKPRHAEVDGGLETISMNLPAIVTADLRFEWATLRHLHHSNIMKAKKKPLDTTTPEAFGVDVAPRLKNIESGRTTRKSRHHQSRCGDLGWKIQRSQSAG